MARGIKRVARPSSLTFPKTFRARQIAANGTKLYVRVGGSGPAVLLLHGYGETGDMWVPLADNLARDRTVVVPDLRGMGLSAKPASGYDKKTQANDIAGTLDALKIERAALVTHDIGNMVGYAFAAQYRHRVTRFVVIDAPLPGVGPWEEILKNPLLWHFRFGGPDMERLVAGRERIYLDRFWNEFSATPKRFREAARRHYAKLYARPGAMHAGFAQFAAFDQDAAEQRRRQGRGPARVRRFHLRPWRSRPVCMPGSWRASTGCGLPRSRVGAAIGRTVSHALLATVVHEPEAGSWRSATSSHGAGLLPGKACRPMRATCSACPGTVRGLSAGVLRAPRTCATPVSPKPSKANSRRSPRTNRSYFARHCTEANLIEKAAGFWGKAGQHSLERSSILACHRPQPCSVQDAAPGEFDDLGRDQARGGVVFVAQTQLCAHALKHDRHDADRLGFENCPIEKNRHCRPGGMTHDQWANVGRDNWPTAANPAMFSTGCWTTAGAID